MLKWICVAVLAFAVSPALAIDTDSNVTKPPGTGQVTLKVEQTDASGKPVGQPQRVTIPSNRNSASKRWNISSRAAKVIVTVEGTPESKTVDRDDFVSGRVEVGGIVLVNTPSQAASGPGGPGRQTSAPDTGVPSEVGGPSGAGGPSVAGFVICNRTGLGIFEKLAVSGVTTFQSRDTDNGCGGGGSITYDSWFQSGAVTFSPFVSGAYLNQDVRHTFPNGSYIGEVIKFFGTLGVQMGVMATPEAQVYLLGGVAVANKELTINFGAGASTSNDWVWGPTVGFGVAWYPRGLRLGDRQVRLFAQIQRAFLEDAHFRMPSVSPAFNYAFGNTIDILTLGVAVALWEDRNSRVLSDIRVKRDIAPVGELDGGLKLYRYKYIWSDTEYVGVMAQEVAALRPNAVARGADGYLRVNYAMLGLRLQTWKEWLAAR